MFDLMTYATMITKYCPGISTDTALTKPLRLVRVCLVVVPRTFVVVVIEYTNLLI